jgi:hypothetical protein
MVRAFCGATWGHGRLLRGERVPGFVPPSGRRLGSENAVHRVLKAQLERSPRRFVARRGDTTAVT